MGARYLFILVLCYTLVLISDVTLGVQSLVLMAVVRLAIQVPLVNGNVLVNSRVLLTT